MELPWPQTSQKGERDDLAASVRRTHSHTVKTQHACAPVASCYLSHSYFWSSHPLMWTHRLKTFKRRRAKRPSYYLATPPPSLSSSTRSRSAWQSARHSVPRSALLAVRAGEKKKKRKGESENRGSKGWKEGNWREEVRWREQWQWKQRPTRSRDKMEASSSAAPSFSRRDFPSHLEVKPHCPGQYTHTHAGGALRGGQSRKAHKTAEHHCRTLNRTLLVFWYLQRVPVSF